MKSTGSKPHTLQQQQQFTFTDLQQQPYMHFKHQQVALPVSFRKRMHSAGTLPRKEAVFSQDPSDLFEKGYILPIPFRGRIHPSDTLPRKDTPSQYPSRKDAVPSQYPSDPSEKGYILPIPFRERIHPPSTLPTLPRKDTPSQYPSEKGCGSLPVPFRPF